jgi:hypothetical protein
MQMHSQFIQKAYYMVNVEIMSKFNMGSLSKMNSFFI